MTPGIDLAKAAFTEEGIPGAVVSLYLHEKHIIPEKSDSYSTLYLLTPGEGQVDMNGLFSALMAFEDAYLTKAPLSSIMPELVAQYPDRYKITPFTSSARSSTTITKTMTSLSSSRRFS